MPNNRLQSDVLRKLMQRNRLNYRNIVCGLIQMTSILKNYMQKNPSESEYWIRKEYRLEKKI